MKEKILMFIIGALVGVIITAGGFMIFNNSNNKVDFQRGQKGEVNFENMGENGMQKERQKGNKVQFDMQNGTNELPQMPDENFEPNGNMGNPPEMNNIDNQI